MVKVEKISPQQAQSQLQLLNAIAMMIEGKKRSTSNKWHYDKTFALFMQPCHGPDLVFQVVLSLSGTDFTNDSYWLCG